MSIAASRGFLIAATLLLVLWQGGGWTVAAAKSDVSNAKSWLDKAFREKHCPSGSVANFGLQHVMLLGEVVLSAHAAWSRSLSSWTASVSAQGPR
ncbi:MAG: hypothetical protein WA417_22630, partial [Stellaceae bacterium]